MTETKEHIPLLVERMPDGGFLVGEARFSGELYNGPLFAATSIGEALEFIARRLDPAALEVLKRAQADQAMKAAEAAKAADAAKPVRCRCESMRYTASSAEWAGA
jgi:phosphoribosylamine-glycine ligase